jgi:hypothetical protein
VCLIKENSKGNMSDGTLLAMVTSLHEFHYFHCVEIGWRLLCSFLVTTSSKER